MSREAASWADRGLARIAVDGAALGELVLRETTLVRARAALQILGAEGAEQVGSAQRLAGAGEAERKLEDLRDAVAGDPGGRGSDAERVEGGRDAADPAECIGEAGVPEVVEPAGELRRICPQRRDLVEGVLERVRRRRQRAGARRAVPVDRTDPDRGKRILEAGELDQVVGGAGLLDDLAEALD